MNAAVARIAARYGSGALIALGFNEDLAHAIGTDPDVQALIATVVAVVAAAVTEWAYALAKKYGWRT